MAVSYNLISGVAPNFADNLCQWDGQSAGHYEVWFLTLNQRATGLGFWFRYTLEIPQASQKTLQPRAKLWAAYFDRKAAENHLGLMQEHPIEVFRTDKAQFNVQIEDARLSSSQTTGKIETDEHHIAWDLQFVPNPTTHQHIPRSFISLVRPSSFICSPNLNTRFSGIVDVDGKSIYINDEPGCQTHLWGSKQVDEWLWLHSNAFDKHDDTVFEGLAARPRRAGATLPPIQSFYLKHRGEEFRFRRVSFAEQWRKHLGIGFWTFSASNTRTYIEGSAQCRLRDMLQARHLDPDGEPIYAVNSEIANLKIRIFRRLHGLRWKHTETITAHSTAHLEHASRIADEQVRLITRSKSTF